METETIYYRWKRREHLIEIIQDNDFYWVIHHREGIYKSTNSLDLAISWTTVWLDQLENTQI